MCSIYEEIDREIEESFRRLDNTLGRLRSIIETGIDDPNAMFTETIQIENKTYPCNSRGLPIPPPPKIKTKKKRKKKRCE